jgi:hypothetical protein
MAECQPGPLVAAPAKARDKECPSMTELTLFIMAVSICLLTVRLLF